MTKSNLVRKSLAIVTAVTVWASVASPALAITAEELLAQIQALQAQLNALLDQYEDLTGGETPTVSGCTITSFDRNLKQGMSGDDVKCLQIVLNTSADTKVADSGAGSPGNETSYFGPLTRAAVIKFQEKYASSVLAPWGLTSGTGFVGSTTRDKLNAMLAGGEVPSGGEVGTAAKVMLASDTPAASQVALGAQDVAITKIKFSAGADAYTVSKIVVSRGGIAADQDVESIKLYDGTTQVGSTQALNTTTHKATFSGLSWEIPSYGVKYLTIKVSIAAKGVATVGDSLQLGIASASDLTATVTPSGTYPMMGNGKTIAGITVGELWVQKRNVPADTTVLSGATDQEIACWTFQASGTEGVSVHSIKVTHVGTAARDDVLNLKLKYIATQIGSTVASLDSSNQATFDLSSSPLQINGGASKAICAYADIASGIWTSRTIIFEITQETDVTAYGDNTGGKVTIGYDDATVFSKQTGNTMMVGQGVLNVALDAAENPASQNYVKGTTNRLITAVKFSTGATEGARVTKLRFTLAGSSAAATDISNVTLWDGSTQIAGPASIIGSYVTFGANTIGWDTSGLFDVEKSSNKTILVKADIPLGATSGHGVKLSIASASDVWADGMDSMYDLPSGSIVGNATGNEHTIDPYGSLAVSLASDTPIAQIYVTGADNKEFTKFNFTAGSGEDIILSSVVVSCYVGSGQTTACTSGTTTNAKLVKEDLSQFGTAVASPGATASFSGSLTIPAGETKALTLVADIPTNIDAASIHWDIPSGSASTDLTSSGAYSGADIVEGGSADGKLMTIGQGSLAVTVAPTPADQTLIVGASEVPIVGLVLTAGTSEDIRVTRVMLASSYASSGESSSTDLSAVALWEGTARLTAKKNLSASTTYNSIVTFTASDFINGQGINMTAGSQKTITVKADLPSTAIANHTISLGVPYASAVSVTGLSSNSSLTPTVTPQSGSLTGANYLAAGHAELYLVTLYSAGVLTIETTADTPIIAIQGVGPEGTLIPGVAFHKSYFYATLESIDIKSISVRRDGGRDSDFGSVSLYEGDTLLAGPQALSNGSTTFNFASDSYWRIPKSGARYLTIKASVNGIRTYFGSGSETGDAPKLGLGNVAAVGVDSGQTSLTGVGWVNKMGNEQILRQSKPTIGVASAASSVYGAGTKELFRWTVTAGATGNVGWNKVVFDISGSVVQTPNTYTVGSSNDAVRSDGVYMSTTTTWGSGAIPVLLISASSTQVWDVDTNTQVSPTSTANSWWVDQAASTGTARVYFVPATEQEIAAGTTKTYKLMANILQSGTAGSSLLTKIESRSDANFSTDYATAAATTTATLIWSDRSGASGLAGHSTASSDWTNDYKVPGIPTSAWTLSQ